MINRYIFYVILVPLFFLTSPASAKDITPTPGTYELLEGASMQFNARQSKQKVKASELEWVIVHGSGGKLLNARSPRVTFVAPSRVNEDTRSFTLELRTRYPNGLKPSKAQINIRVHRKTEKIVKRKASPWLHGTVGFGFGYLWGGWWPYPPVIIIPPPPPGEIWPPEEIPPIAVPLPEDPSFNEWAAQNPDLADPLLVDTEVQPEQLPAVIEQPLIEIDGPEAFQPIESAPELSIEPAPLSEPEITPMIMDTPEPMDTPMMDMDMDMDFGGFD
jgi:hypothetical protein